MSTQSVGSSSVVSLKGRYSVLSCWLPIPERIDHVGFKLLLLAFKSLNDVAPPYMEELLVLDQQELCTLQIKDSKSKNNLKTYGYRAFPHAAPKIWNSMPVSLRTCCELSVFKSKIKTFLFKSAFRLHFMFFLNN